MDVCMPVPRLKLSCIDGRQTVQMRCAGPANKDTGGDKGLHAGCEVDFDKLPVPASVLRNLEIEMGDGQGLAASRSVPFSPALNCSV